MRMFSSLTYFKPWSDKGSKPVWDSLANKAVVEDYSNLDPIISNWLKLR